MSVNLLLIIVVPVVFVVVAAGPMASFAKLGLLAARAAAPRPDRDRRVGGRLPVRDRHVLPGLGRPRHRPAAGHLRTPGGPASYRPAGCRARPGGTRQRGGTGRARGPHRRDRRPRAGDRRNAYVRGHLPRHRRPGRRAGAQPAQRHPADPVRVDRGRVPRARLRHGRPGGDPRAAHPLHHPLDDRAAVWPAGIPGNLGWALAWTIGAAAAAWAVVTATSRTARTRHLELPGTVGDQLIAATRAGLLDWGRNRALWALLAAVPAVFILMTKVTTPAKLVRIALTERGRQVTTVVNLAAIHPAVMAPIAIASLAAVAGMFMMLDSRAGDEHLVLAGQRPGPLLAARLSLIAVAAMVATTVSLAVTATVSDIRQWGVYIAANVLVAATYALVGVLIGPLFGRVAGVFIAFLIPFTDLGISQSPMLRPTPATWAHFLPGYGAEQIVMNGILAPSFDETARC